MTGTVTMTIGELSRRTGCVVETIRYYERIGMMPDPPRSAGGHRMYNEGHEKRLTFIRRGRALGFTLDEVRGLLGMVDGGDYSCEDIRTVAVAHIAEIRRKIADLRRIEKVLRDMAEQCDTGVVPECPIVEAMFRPPAPRGRSGEKRRRQTG